MTLKATSTYLNLPPRTRGEAMFAREASHLDQSQAAFNRAIRTGRLSDTVGAPNYVGDYMFMGFDPQGRACFKHRDTRAYLAHEVKL